MHTETAACHAIRCLILTGAHAGDLLCPLEFQNRSECRLLDPLRTDSARSQAQEVSGYNCGSERDCIQADGSGYYVLTDQDIADGPLTGFSQAHDFHLMYLPGANQSEAPQLSPGFYVSASVEAIAVLSHSCQHHCLVTLPLYRRAAAALPQWCS